ncbi:MAG: hypothetical protein CL928_02065 [Deltaproteobacteria bacterium]|nr:hypothetical protein [Deltaproteobacteria bacterium]
MPSSSGTGWAPWYSYMVMVWCAEAVEGVSIGPTSSTINRLSRRGRVEFRVSLMLLLQAAL